MRFAIGPLEITLGGGAVLQELRDGGAGATMRPRFTATWRSRAMAGVFTRQPGRSVRREPTASRHDGDAPDDDRDAGRSGRDGRDGHDGFHRDDAGRDGAAGSARRHAASATTAAALVNEIAALAAVDGRVLDNPTLQSIAYYASAWWSTRGEGPLVEEPFVAVPWGACLRSAMRSRANPISLSDPVLRIVFDPGAATPLSCLRPAMEEGEAKDFVALVYERHQAFGGERLCESIKAPGEPWSYVADFIGSLEGAPPIPEDLVAFCFKRKQGASS